MGGLLERIASGGTAGQRLFRGRCVAGAQPARRDFADGTFDHGRLDRQQHGVFPADPSGRTGQQGGLSGAGGQGVEKAGAPLPMGGAAGHCKTAGV